VKKTVHVGHSVGAIYALGYAQTFPSEVGGLILLDPISNVDLSSYQAAVNQFNLFTKIGLTRLMSLFSASENIPQFAHTDIIKTISVSDNFASAVTLELVAIPSLVRSVISQYKRLDIPIDIFISNEMDSFSVIPASALSFHYNNQELLKLLKENEKTVNENKVQTSHSKLPFSNIISVRLSQLLSKR